MEGCFLNRGHIHELEACTYFNETITRQNARARLMLKILLPFLFVWKSEDAQSNT